MRKPGMAFGSSGWTLKSQLDAVAGSAKGEYRGG
jgi:hypothetical protein